MISIAEFCNRASGRFLIIFCSLFILTACEGEKTETVYPHVQYVEVRSDNVALTTELPGRVSALTVAEVRPQVSGIIKKRFFTEGSDVREGQVLYQIDPALFEATYKNAKAELFKAKANLVSARLLAVRYGKIVDSDAVSRQEYDDAVAAYGQARGAVEAARQAVETARINLGYTRITAPVSGRIGKSFVTAGALVTQNQAEPLSTIQHLDTVYVDVTQSSQELLQLRRALSQGNLMSDEKATAKVKLKLEDGTPYANGSDESGEPDWIKGNLLFSDITIDATTGVVGIRAQFENPAHVLLPNMYVKAILEEGIQQNAIMVPQKAVTRDMKGRSQVYVLSKDAPDKQESGSKPNQKLVLAENEYYVSSRYVTQGQDYHNNWLITEGLKSGEKVLVEGLQKVRPGQIVVAAPAAEDNVKKTGDDITSGPQKE